MKQSRKVIVTGANGNVASSLIAKNYFEALPIYRDNWNELDSYLSQDVDAIVHTAYDLKNSYDQEPTSLVESNIASTTMLLEKMLQNPPKKFIFLSTCAVYGTQYDVPETEKCTPTSINGVVKLLNEKIISVFCESHNIDYLILRVFNLYGGDDKFSVVNRLLNATNEGENFILNNKGKSYRDFIHVDDLCEILNILIETEKSGKQILNVGTGEATSIIDLFNHISKIKKLNFTESSVPEVHFSRADITKLNDFISYKFKTNIFDYINLKLSK